MEKINAFDENEYFLFMNKNVVIAKFYVDKLLDTPIIVEQFVQLPEWIGDLDNLIAHRYPVNNRKNIDEIIFSIFSIYWRNKKGY